MTISERTPYVGTLRAEARRDMGHIWCARAELRGHEKAGTATPDRRHPGRIALGKARNAPGGAVYLISSMARGAPENPGLTVPTGPGKMTSRKMPSMFLEPSTLVSWKPA